MHFIPNPANTEFIYLTGLEECVNRILNLDSETPHMPPAFMCSQCSTDFTPTWKWDKAAKGEHCTAGDTVQLADMAEDMPWAVLAEPAVRGGVGWRVRRWQPLAYGLHP
jgi:hypothetical protein